jgi:hypothetical protein
MLQVLGESTMKHYAPFFAVSLIAAALPIGCATQKPAPKAPTVKPTSAARPAYESPVTQMLNKVPEKREQSIALRSLSKLLRAHPRARVATVAWLRKEQRREALLNTMSLDRAQNFLLIEWADDCSRTIPTGEDSVHHFADIGRIDRSGASECY